MTYTGILLRPTTIAGRWRSTRRSSNQLLAVSAGFEADESRGRIEVPVDEIEIHPGVDLDDWEEDADRGATGGTRCRAMCVPKC